MKTKIMKDAKTFFKLKRRSKIRKHNIVKHVRTLFKLKRRNKNNRFKRQNNWKILEEHSYKVVNTEGEFEEDYHQKTILKKLDHI